MVSAATTNRFDRWASRYEDNTLQQYLFVPVHLAAQRMTVISNDHTPWFSLPDIQVIAARQQPQRA
jgi:hypothetical protein